MAEYLRADVFPSEVDYSAYVKSISTSTAGIVGVFQKGPVGSPTLVTSLEEAQRIFGTYLSGYYGMFALKNFFENGGSRAYVVRTVKHTADVAQSATATVSLDDRAGAPLDTLQVNAISPGAWANGTVIAVEASTADPTNAFTLIVKSATGTILETFKDIYIGASKIGDIDYCEKRINGVSQYITVVDLLSATAAPTNMPALIASAPLASGADGLTGITTADFIGASGTSVGLYALDSVDVNMVAIPGESSSDTAAAAIGNALITYCELRKDCVGILEAPAGKTAQTLAAFRKSPNAGAAFNSSYGALYGPWLKSEHPVSGKAITLPPSGFVLGIIARNDAQGAVWTAPAGLNRAVIRGASAPEVRFGPADRDVVYSAGVNPIALVAGSLTINGQKTLQLKSSATDRLNVRRLLNYIEKAISDSGQFFVFEANNKATWEGFKRLVNPFLQRIKDGGGFYDFLTICDATLNTPANIDANIMKARVLVKPTRTAEFLPVEFAIAPTSADFSELK